MKLTFGLEIYYFRFDCLGWGAHYSNYSTPYLTAAAALGMDKKEVDNFVEKLDECLEYYKASRKFAKLQLSPERNNNALML